jgi:hypothetical protein
MWVWCGCSSHCWYRSRCGLTSVGVVEALALELGIDTALLDIEDELPIGRISQVPIPAILPGVLVGIVGPGGDRRRDTFDNGECFL